jgi:ubiquinone/menaquinone biosynthesis C-methylase UbiE
MNNDLQTWDTGADDYLSVASNGDGFKVYVDDPAFMQVLGSVEGKDILDIGCGDGMLCKKLRAAGARVTGVDGSPNMIRNAQANDPEGDFRTIDLLGGAWPFPDGSFDIVTAKMMLMNVGSLEAIATESHRVLKPGGLLAVDVVHPFRPFFKNLSTPGKYTSDGGYFEQTHGSIRFAGKEFAFYYRPVMQYVNDFLSAGFSLASLNELGVTESFAKEHPEMQDKVNQPVALHLAFRR